MSGEGGEAGVTIEHRQEWSVHLVGELGVFGTEHTLPALEGKHHARATLDRWRRTRPDVTSTLVSREVEIRRQAWTPVENV
jgi:hypothetical protein